MAIRIVSNLHDISPEIAENICMLIFKELIGRFLCRQIKENVNGKYVESNATRAGDFLVEI